MNNADAARWMGAALALGERGRGRTAPNPSVGCIIVAGDRVVGRGWTQPGGRPHAEAMAIVEAGATAHGATAVVTLEPCATLGRGPACAETLIAAGVARVIVAIADPFPTVDGRGIARLRAAGIAVDVGIRAADAERSMAGFLMRQRSGRPQITLKLAMSIDGAIAMADGTSRWITGPVARAHAHLERSRHDAIVVGGATFRHDAPTLDVRLAGLAGRGPRRLMLTRGVVPDGWEGLAAPQAVHALDRGINEVLVEGGGKAASAFLRHDLVDRLLVYRAPVLIGGGRSLAWLGLTRLADAHGRWVQSDCRQLGSDQLDVYERTRS